MFEGCILCVNLCTESQVVAFSLPLCGVGLRRPGISMDFAVPAGSIYRGRKAEGWLSRGPGSEIGTLGWFFSC